MPRPAGLMSPIIELPDSIETRHLQSGDSTNAALLAQAAQALGSRVQCPIC